MKAIKEYVDTHKDRFLEELFDLIRIPSVSSKAEAKGDMSRAAEYIRKACSRQEPIMRR